MMTEQNKTHLKTSEQLLSYLSELGLETETFQHEAVFTVEESRAIRGEMPGGHSKNLFLKDKKGVLWLVVCEEDRPIDMKALRKVIGAANLSFGKPDLLLELLGVTPGSVTPFALINDTDCQLRVILDKGLMAYVDLHFHPLTNTATTRISPNDLLKFIHSCGHQPEIHEI